MRSIYHHHHPTWPGYLSSLAKLLSPVYSALYNLPPVLFWLSIINPIINITIITIHTSIHPSMHALKSCHSSIVLKQNKLKLLVLWLHPSIYRSHWTRLPCRHIHIHTPLPAHTYPRRGVCSSTTHRNERRRRWQGASSSSSSSSSDGGVLSIDHIVAHNEDGYRSSIGSNTDVW